MKNIYICFLFAFLTYSCLDTVDMPGGVLNKKLQPTVETASVQNPEEKILICTGALISSGEATILEKGFCWSSTNMEPTVNDQHLPSSNSTNTFADTLKNIVGSKTYYIRAYAQNEHGYSYGDTISFVAPKILEERPIFPPQIRTMATIFSMSERLYVTCGENINDILGDTWMFNVKENKWTACQNYRGASRRQAAAFVIDSTTAYVGTGRTGRTTIFFKDFYKLVQEELWDSLAIIPPFSTRAECASSSFKQKGYLIGGRPTTTTTLAEVWRYSPGEANPWKALSDFPIQIHQGIAINQNNERFYAGFGSDKDLFNIKNLWEYNDSSDTWTLFTIAPDEFGDTYTGSAVVIENKAYFIDFSNVIWELDLSTKEWKVKVDLSNVFPKNTDTKNGSQYLYAYKHSIFVGLNNTNIFYEYRPFWDN